MSLLVPLPQPGDAIRGLSLHQPWATLIAVGAKRYETRDWDTPYRGWVAIHSSATMPPAAQHICLEQPFLKTLSKHDLIDGIDQRGGHRVLRHHLPLGQVVALAYLDRTCRTDWFPLAKELEFWPYERYFGNYDPERYAYRFSTVLPVEPYAVKGNRNFWPWTVPDDLSMGSPLPRY